LPGVQLRLFPQVWESRDGSVEIVYRLWRLRAQVQGKGDHSATQGSGHPPPAIVRDMVNENAMAVQTAKGMMKKQN